MEVVDLVAATLRRVAGEATRVAGGPVADVRLVVPAGWGPRRRTWLRQAAHRAGLGQPRLVEAPVAVAEHLLATGAQMPVGSYLVMCDAGGGFEVTVLRRGPAGVEVLSTLTDPDAGGLGVDDALAGLLLPADGSITTAGGWPVVASIRAGKESLSDHAAVTVPVPGGPPVVVSGLMVEQTARPVWERAGKLAVEAVAAAEISTDQVTGVYLVGGSARMPATGQVLGEHLGVVPVVLPDPQTAAARGAADAGTTPPGGPVAVAEPEVPPVRRALSIAVPGLASLWLLAHFFLTAERNNTVLSVHYWVNANWGELAMAAMFALIACLSAGTILGSLATPADTDRPARSVGGQVGTGILTAIGLGMTVAAVYAVVGASYLSLELRPFLRWTLLPLIPTIVLAALVALVAARGWRTPRHGWRLRIAPGDRRTACPGRAGQPQAGRADHAATRRRGPAPTPPQTHHHPGSGRPAGAGPDRPGLHRHRTRPALVRRHHLPTRRHRLAVSGHGHRHRHPQTDRLVDQHPHAHEPGHRCPRRRGRRPRRPGRRRHLPRRQGRPIRQR
ncbi:Hsp70 family protein [Micromonospora echinofusca]|uniref:Hsp70 family protein n=1 Tax=Micromonospora echinofusca TaxID=47858 RepID=A0ABS3W127_MICEH|nr:Hsp70 family protein [Micromonospora echinofusca]